MLGVGCTCVRSGVVSVEARPEDGGSKSACVPTAPPFPGLGLSITVPVIFVVG